MEKHCLLPYRMASELPFARGLGSSAAAIVAGIELANKCCDLNLTTQDKLKISSQMEGHPDNATASIFGGFNDFINGRRDIL